MKTIRNDRIRLPLTRPGFRLFTTLPAQPPRKLPATPPHDFLVLNTRPDLLPGEDSPTEFLRRCFGGFQT
jgi:hypothetical protein